MEPTSPSPAAADAHSFDPEALLASFGLGIADFELRRLDPFGLQLTPRGARDDDWMHEGPLHPRHRPAFFDVIDRFGMVSVLGQHPQHPTYRGVRGRSSKGRLSQGEYYHHDGCSGPVKPRVVEIRCPIQDTPRHIATAVAPFPTCVGAMIRELPAELSRQLTEQWAQDEALARAAAQLVAEVVAETVDGSPSGETSSIRPENAVSDEVADRLQGAIIRAVRREFDAERARAYLRAVDRSAGAYTGAWQIGESRFIANRNEGRTMQHRRAHLVPVGEGGPNGHLCKRWPEDELAEFEA